MIAHSAISFDRDSHVIGSASETFFFIDIYQ